MAKSKKAAPKKAGKKAAPKKAAPKSAKRAKKKAVAKKARPEDLTALPEAIPPTGNCFCMERDGLFFCMRKMRNGSFKECPTLAAFATLEECQQHSCP